MEILYVFLFLIFGLFVGFMSGAMGIGGGVIMVPVFLIFFELQGLPRENAHFFAIGSSLFAAVLASTSGAIRHFKNKNVDLKLGLVFAIFAVISSSILSKIALTTSVNVLKGIFAAVLLLIAIRMSLKEKKIETEGTEINKKLFLLIPVVGAIIGMLSAFTGIGGGILAVPVFYYLFKMSFKKSIGTSSFVIIFSVLAALISYSLAKNVNIQHSAYTVGFINLLVALPTGVGAIVSAKYGADFALHSDTKKLKYIFSLLIVVTFLKLVFELFS